MTRSPKKASRASLVARVGALLSQHSLEYFETTVAASASLSLQIDEDARILAFFFGLIG